MLWIVNLFFQCHSCIFSAACLSFDVRVCPTELPWIQQRVFGWWEESGIFGTWVTFQHIHYCALSHSPLFRSLTPSLWQERKKKKHRREQGGWTKQKCCSQTPISLVSTRRGTVRIQNTHPRPKPRNAPLSTPRQLPVLLCKVPAGCQSHCGIQGQLNNPGALWKETRGQEGKTVSVWKCSG